ncbi:hypothetical protein J2X02_003534 [Pseudoxanthomonas japonensis]|uniref:hypothetical protein n=1 Tax=Pseudoxanthomonas japonensis TaxID=69284 RepID=UPI002857025E|nr:hypothetical protein [Pseudoxanthomonas japonensis]MDR7070669.1 hypothetical protein [Pseudoxanthomonas japonensis]
MAIFNAFMRRRFLEARTDAERRWRTQGAIAQNAHYRARAMPGKRDLHHSPLRATAYTARARAALFRPLTRSL